MGMCTNFELSDSILSHNFPEGLGKEKIALKSQLTLFEQQEKLHKVK